MSEVGEAKRETRRRVVKGIGALGLLVALVRTGVPGKVLELLGGGSPETPEQIEARNKLIEAVNTKKGLVTGLVVGENGANLRSTPQAFFEGEGSAGNLIGKLGPNTKVEAAIEWMGTGATIQGARELWYAFFNPQYKAQIVFSFGGNFEQPKNP